MDLLELPLDILINILSTLPAESLYIIRCVSKALLKMVDDPSFVTLHTGLQVPQLVLFTGSHYHHKPEGIEVLASPPISEIRWLQGLDQRKTCNWCRHKENIQLRNQILFSATCFS